MEFQTAQRKLRPRSFGVVVEVHRDAGYASIAIAARAAFGAAKGYI